ncbi:MAG: SMP-30/gluconolactonase/LRE family protein [Bacilli bacterium]
MKKIEMNFRVGESPLYDEVNDIFYCVDIIKKKVFKIKDDIISEVSYDQHCGLCFLDEDNLLYVVLIDGIYLVNFDTKQLTKVRILSLKEGFRSNDGKVMINGQLMFGIMNNEYNEGNKPATHDGCFYQLGTTLSIINDHVAVSNGIVFLNDSYLYIDSLDKNIKRFDYNHQLIKVLDLPLAVYDGMCLKNDTQLYVACYNKASILVIDFEKEVIVEEIQFNERAITSCCVGGVKADKLFVTSASLKGEGSLYILDIKPSIITTYRFKKDYLRDLK